MSKDYKKQTFRCRVCGTECRVGHFWVTDDEVVLCDNCFDHNTATCEECGTILYDPEDYPKDVFYFVSSKLICKDCFVKYRKAISLKGGLNK